MKLFFAKTRAWGARAVRLCRQRFLVLAMTLAVAAGSVLVLPVFATDRAAETAAIDQAEPEEGPLDEVPEVAESAADTSETPLLVPDAADAVSLEADTVSTEESLTEDVPADVDMNYFKLLEYNMAALKKATVPGNADYTGAILPLRNVTVTADGQSVVLCLQAGTKAAQAVEASGITRGEEDFLNVPETRYVTDGLEIAITRVTYQEYTKDFSIAFSTETRYTSDLRQGASKVSQAGVAGVRTVTYRQRLENGEVVSTETVKEEITRQPVKKIILKGTKVGKVVSEAPFDIPLDSAGQPLNYTKKLTGSATAYTSDRGDSGTHTASGRLAQVGVVAVDPRVIPYGTKLWIVSRDGTFVYGYAVAGDTGGAVRSGKLLVDLYFDTYGECSRFGRRTMNVYVLP